jgi:plastocyanin
MLLGEPLIDALTGRNKRVSLFPRNRRNMTEADLLRCIDAVDKRREQREVTASQCKDEGGRFKPSPSSEGDGKSKGTAEKTASIVGTSRSKVERARQVLSDPKEMEENAFREEARALAISAGENINWVARRLGHKTPVVTLEKYNRFVPNLTRTDGKTLVEAGNFAQQENLVEEYQ